jgi:hypothetical protein
MDAKSQSTVTPGVFAPGLARIARAGGQGAVRADLGDGARRIELAGRLGESRE